MSRTCMFQLRQPSRAVIAEQEIREDTRARVRQQPSRLLQQPAARQLYGVSEELLQKLRSFRTQPYVCRVVTEARKFDHYHPGDVGDK